MRHSIEGRSVHESGCWSSVTSQSLSPPGPSYVPGVKAAAIKMSVFYPCGAQAEVSRLQIINSTVRCRGTLKMADVHGVHAGVLWGRGAEEGFPGK